eukprot:CAMPEP_0113582714 /NCGR_PEP_ID=MMETSP0015_2-20120614/32079_1 /TAXON_ID=2838 /ORGANISM="Odontella" /LENGTH=40 /DNA_ID=CAMNT_0000487439 /DNA_START=72 /DNA_END=191 /DNA_ORIENTATION=- /assembly_acc=CAM_ASM_000160
MTIRSKLNAKRPPVVAWAATVTALLLAGAPVPARAERDSR